MLRFADICENICGLRLEDIMKKRIAIVGGTIVAVAVAGGVSWYLWNHKGSSSEQDKVYVTTVATLMGDVSGTQNRYAGVVEPQKTVKVKVDSSRKVKTVKVKEGDQVSVGDVLFEYDESAAQDDLAQAELDLERLKNEANSLQNQIDTLTKEKKEALREASFRPQQGLTIMNAVQKAVRINGKEFPSPTGVNYYESLPTKPW